jgi:hypothetical protein
MNSAAVQLVRMERRQAKVIVGVNHPDPFLRNTQFAHSLACDYFQEFIIPSAEVLGVLVDVIGNGFQTAGGGRKADHRGWWLSRRSLAMGAACKPFDSFSEAAEKARYAARSLHEPSIPRRNDRDKPMKPIPTSPKQCASQRKQPHRRCLTLRRRPRARDRSENEQLSYR